MVKKIALVCNPTSENARALLLADRIAVLLRKKSVAFSLFTTYWPQVWDEFTDAWIIGGDGTMNFFINQYPDIKLPLAVFNGGTGNDFHWMLYDDADTEIQIDRCLQGNQIQVDAGVCNDRLFLNGVGIGFDGAIVKDLLGKKKMAGKASYLLSILKNVMRFQETDAVLAVDGEIIRQETFMISVANGKRYGGGFHVAPQASLTDAMLDVNMVAKIPALKRIRYLPVIEKGDHLDLPFIKYRQGKEITIETAADWPGHIDGEFIHGKKFVIGILPKKFLFSV
jgi:YegS/Rv2252/BmrU family lipid kinase